MAGNIGSLLSMGQTALLSQQNNIHITGNNIANVDTPGYSRQTPNIVERPALNVAPGQVGQGAWTQEVMRHFDKFVERSFLQKNAAQSRYQSEYNMMQSVESLFNEANSKGISSLMNQFFTGWRDIAKTPDSIPVREVLLSQSQNLSSTIRQTEEYLQTYQQRLDTLIGQDVDKINNILKQIADLNKQINIYDDPGNNNANTLLDQRDSAVRELSKYIDVDVVDRGRGDYSVYTKAGHTLVQEITPFSLSFEGPKTKNLTIDGSLYNGTVQHTGSSYQEYTLEVVNGGAVGTAQYKVSLDGGNSWLKDENGNDRLFTATNSSNVADVEGLGIYFDGTTALSVGDRFEICPKSAVYWVTPTTEKMNISPQLMGNGTENDRRMTGGSLAGYLYVRDYDIGNYRDQLDHFAQSVIWEVNFAHSQGTGLIKNDFMEGTYGVQQTTTALGDNTSGLTFFDRLQPGNLNFYFYDDATGKLATPNSYGPLDFDNATAGIQNFDPAVHSLEDVRDAINNTHGVYVTAQIQDNRLVINSNAGFQFGVGGDTTGLLAGLGLNTFFAGNGSSDININSTISQDLRKICAGAINGASEGNEGDNDVALTISKLSEKKVDIPGRGWNQPLNTTLSGYYGTLVSKVGSDTRQSKFNYQYENTLASDLDARQAEVSGVNLDEELTLLIKYQNSYKAAAKLVTTADQMFQTLLGLKQ